MKNNKGKLTFSSFSLLAELKTPGLKLEVPQNLGFDLTGASQCFIPSVLFGNLFKGA